MARDYARRTRLVVGHLLQLEYFINGVPLQDAVLNAWQCQLLDIVHVHDREVSRGWIDGDTRQPYPTIRA